MNTNEEIKWYKEYRNKVLGLGSDYRPSEHETKYKQSFSKHQNYPHKKQTTMNQTSKYYKSITLTFLIVFGLTSCAYYEPGSQNNSVSTYVTPQYNYAGYGYGGYGYGGYYPYGGYGNYGYGGYYPYGGYGWWGGGYGWGRGCGW